MTSLQQSQSNAQMPVAPSLRVAGKGTSTGTNLFWLLLAPLCSLLDSRFRRYASNREAAGEREWLNAGLRLPDAKSYTSWSARKEMGVHFPPTQFPPTQVHGARASDTWLS